MATVDLTSVWMNLVSVPSDGMQFPMMSKLLVMPERIGEAREYANGRVRLIRKATRKNTFQVVLPECTRTQIQWLEKNIGELMFIRDDRGRRVWGVYFKASIDEHPEDIDLADVDITFNEITHTEAI